jgi:NADPH:quinone reductase-like Zn-dependent oxidoreductase
VSGLRWLPDLCWPPKLVSSFPGLLNRLEFVDDTKWNTPMGDHDVEVEVKAAALNFLDVMGALGQSQQASLEQRALELSPEPVRK